MNKLILLSEEQMNDLTAILNEVDLTKSKLFGFGEIYKKLCNLRAALSHDLTDEIMGKIESIDELEDIAPNDEAAHWIQKDNSKVKLEAQSIINSYKGGK